MIWIVINTRAGRQQIRREKERIAQVFLSAGKEVRIVETSCKRDTEDLLREARLTPPELLICCGGDGTLSTTMNAALTAEMAFPLGYIPAGTTNDFANSLKLPHDPVKAARQILEGEDCLLDVGRFGYRHFIYVASFGAFTQTSYNTTQNLKNSLGHLAYVLEGIRELPNLISYEVKVDTDRGQFAGDYIFGAVSNSTSLGGIIKLDANQVKMTDGYLELTLVKKPHNLNQLNKILFSLMSGKYDPEVITFLPITRAAFSCKTDIPWSLDGEYAAGGSKVDIEVCPKALNFRCRKVEEPWEQ